MWKGSTSPRCKRKQLRKEQAEPVPINVKSQAADNTHKYYLFKYEQCSTLGLDVAYYFRSFGNIVDPGKIVHTVAISF